MNNPFIELYEAIYARCSERYETYDHLPGDSANYPFVFLGEQFSEDIITKTRTMGKTNLIIHVFHHDDKRRELNAIMTDVNKLIHELGKTENFTWEVIGSSTNIQYENTERFGTPLAHGVLDIKLEFE